MPAARRLDSFPLDLAGESVILHPYGALFWPSASAVVVTDLHFGKEASFRRAGLPVPDGGMEEDLLKLTHLLEQWNSRRLIITGDLLHDPGSLTPEVIETMVSWRKRFPDVSVELTLGNHDRHASSIPDMWRFNVHRKELVSSPFVFQHEPAPSSEGYVIAGHLHPVFSTGPSKRRRSLRLPCFHVTPDYAVLPAFGHFTGGHPIQRGKADRVFAMAGDRIVEV